MIETAGTVAQRGEQRHAGAVKRAEHDVHSQEQGHGRVHAAGRQRVRLSELAAQQSVYLRKHRFHCLSLAENRKVPIRDLGVRMLEFACKPRSSYSNAMTAPAIEFMNLTRDFGKRRAVDSLHLRVEPGEIFGFLGRNGAGKTTTIRCLLGLARPTAGDARIFGNSIITDTVRALEGVGALVEGAALYDSLCAADHLRAASWLAGTGVNNNITNSAIEELLNTVGLGGRGGDRVSTFSRGMKQRLALATAMLGTPRLLILDEPTDGLDPVGTVEIRILLKKLRANGTTIFLSSHLLAEVHATCDRVAILDQGKLKTVTNVADIDKNMSLEDYFLQVIGAGGGQ